MADQPEEKRKPFPVLSSIISALLGIVVTVVGALILGKLQSTAPHLTYAVVSSTPFNGTNNFVSIYQLTITNDGKREIDEIACFARIPGGKIEQYRTSIAPSIPITENASNDTLKVQIASMNPSDNAAISILATGTVGLPSRPEISIRARGVNGEERTESQKDNDPFSLLKVFGSSLVAVVSASVLFPIVRRTLGKTKLLNETSDQAKMLEIACRALGFGEEADRYSALKGPLLYRDEAERLTAEALQSGDDAAVAKAEKILVVIGSYTGAADESRAVAFFNLARLEAFKKNRDKTDEHLRVARILSSSVTAEWSRKYKM